MRMKIHEEANEQKKIVIQQPGDRSTLKTLLMAESMDNNSHAFANFEFHKPFRSTFVLLSF